MNDDQAKSLMYAVLVDLIFLIAGIVLVGLGTNFYLGFGLAFLLVYHKSVK